MEELISSDSQEKLNKLAKAQLQIVIICPKLNSKLGDLKREAKAENVFKVDKILVMLLGVERNDVVSENFSGKICNIITRNITSTQAAIIPYRKLGSVQGFDENLAIQVLINLA